MAKEYRFPYIYYPLIPVQFVNGEKKTPIIAALIDSGGDSIVIPRAIAEYLGAKIEESGIAKTAGGFTSIKRTKLKMIICKNRDKIEYDKVDVFVSDSSDIPVLLGRDPLFEDFEIIFRKKHKELILRKYQ
ncbi:MAG TPA: aspartyl protease [Thermoplasmatales archaeon]|nr:aspartyl protease [Thermoplasmatales archaeon]HEX16914.1 aspartyl protease [Thermoplasmatales archaeon]